MQTILSASQISFYSGIFYGYQVEFTSKWKSSPCIEVVDLKNIHSLKVELCFIWWEILELLAREAASQITLRELFKGVEES